MALNSGKILMRRGQEVNFDPNKMMPGEWAVSLDSKYVRMCFSPGVCVRMATYDAFEADMVQIQRILAECQTIEEAVKRINDEISVKSQAVAEYTAQAKQYRDEAKAYKEQASAIANVDTATELNMGLMAGGENSVDGGVLTLTKTTNDKTLQKSYKGGIIINEILGESLQDMLPSPDSPQEIKSVKISGIRACGKNLWPYGDISGTRVSDQKNITLEPGVYTVSALITSNDTDSTESMFQIKLEDDTFIYTRLKRDVRNGKTVTIPKRTKTISFFASSDFAKSDGDSFAFKDVQIEEGGETATDYEPYQETKAILSTPITLNGIESVRDILCKQDGAYGILRKLNTKIVKSVDNVQTIGDVNILCNNNTIFTDRKLGANYISDRFQRLSTQSEGNTKEGIIFNTSESNKKYLYLYIDKTRVPASAETTSAYKTSVNNWLANNNISVLYELQNPTFEPLPESDQIALHQLESQNSITHIFIESAIVPAMEVEYGTSKAGAYAIKGMNTAEVNAIRYNSLMAATLMLNQE